MSEELQMPEAQVEPQVEPQVAPQQEQPAKSSEQVTREDFLNSRFLREYQKRQEPESGDGTGETKTVEAETDNLGESEKGEKKGQDKKPKPEEPAKGANEEPEKDTKGDKEEEPNGNEPPAAIKLPDGREVTPEQIAEWEKGHMMQADYTKKTQELAEQRKQFQQDIDWLQNNREQADKALSLWQSFERDPIGTLEMLQAHYNEQGIYEAKPAEQLAREEEMRRLQAEKKKLESERREFDRKSKEEQAYKQINSSLDRIAQDHGEGFDRGKVLRYMAENQVFNVDAAYRAVYHDDKVSNLQKQIDELSKQLKDAKSSAVNEYVEKKQAKSKQPLPVGGTATGAPPVQINPPKTFQDARKAAIARLAGEG